MELGSYLGTSSDTDYVRAPPGGFAPLPDGQGTISPGGRWLAAVRRTQSGITAGTALMVMNRGSGRSRTIPTPGFQLWANSVLSWSSSGTRLFVTAVVDDRNIGFAYGDAPGFRLRLVRVPGGGFPEDSAFFFSNANGTGAVDNIEAGRRPIMSAGPLRFLSLGGRQTTQIHDEVIPSPLSTPFSPSGRLLLTLSAKGQCVLDAVTGATVATIPFVGYDEDPEYPAQDIGLTITAAAA